MRPRTLGQPIEELAATECPVHCTIVQKSTFRRPDFSYVKRSDPTDSLSIIFWSGFGTIQGSWVKETTTFAFQETTVL